MAEIDNFNFHIPKWNELPEIDLYLDQVVTFIDKYLSGYINVDIKKEEKDSTVITKTMINNYVKQKVLDAPVKKKYNRSQIAYLFVICILKQVYSISDINRLIGIGIKDAPIDKAYNIFCRALETSVKCTFSNKRVLNGISASGSIYLLFNVAQTFASKLYVEKTLLQVKEQE